MLANTPNPTLRTKAGTSLLGLRIFPSGKRNEGLEGKRRRRLISVGYLVVKTSTLERKAEEKMQGRKEVRKEGRKKGRGGGEREREKGEKGGGGETCFGFRWCSCMLFSMINCRKTGRTERNTRKKGRKEEGREGRKDTHTVRKERKMVVKEGAGGGWSRP